MLKKSSPLKHKGVHTPYATEEEYHKAKGGEVTEEIEPWEQEFDKFVENPNWGIGQSQKSNEQKEALSIAEEKQEEEPPEEKDPKEVAKNVSLTNFWLEPQESIQDEMYKRGMQLPEISGAKRKEETGIERENAKKISNPDDLSQVELDAQNPYFQKNIWYNHPRGESTITPIPDFMKNMPQDMYGGDRTEVSGTGKMALRTIIKGSEGRYSQIWDAENEEKENIQNEIISNRGKGLFNESRERDYNGDVNLLQEDIFRRGRPYLSKFDQDLADLDDEIKLTTDPKKLEKLKTRRKELAEKKKYVPLKDEKGKTTGWIEKDVDEEATTIAETNEPSTLDKMLRNKYYDLMAMSDIIANKPNERGHSVGPSTFGGSILDKGKNLVGLDNWDDTLEAIKTASETGKLPPGLSEIPGDSEYAKMFNKKLRDFRVMNRALQINADLSKLPQQKWLLEPFLGKESNDAVQENFVNMMDEGGFEIKKSDLPLRDGDGTIRDVSEGIRDFVWDMKELIAAIAITKKVTPAAVTARWNQLHKFMKGANNSRVYKRSVDLTMAAAKEIGVLTGADLTGKALFDSHQMVLNTDSGEIQPSGVMFAGSLGFGNQFASLATRKMLSANNKLTKTLAWLGQSETLAAAGRANLGAASGTATMLFAEKFSENIPEMMAAGGYKSVKEMQWWEGWKHMTEIYGGMLLLGSKGSLTQIGRGMRSDILAGPSSSYRSRAASKHLKIKENSTTETINTTVATEISKIAKDTKLSNEAKTEKIQEIKRHGEELHHYNEIVFAKKAAKKEGDYFNTLGKTSALGNKIRSGESLTAKEIETWSKLKDHELDLMKANMNIAKGSENGQILDVERNRYKNIVETLDAARIFRGKERNNIIEETVRADKIQGEIARLEKMSNLKSGTKPLNDSKIERLKVKLESSYEKIKTQENAYQQKIKRKIEAEKAFADVVERELGAKIKTVDKETFAKLTDNAPGEAFVTGEGEMVVSPERAAEVRQVGVYTHEPIHYILRNSLKNPKTGKISKDGIKIIDDFINELPAEEQAIIQKRINDNYKYRINSEGKKVAKPKEDYYEEYLTSYVDALKNKEIKYTKKRGEDLSDFIIPIARKIFPNLYRGQKYSDKTGKDLLRLMRDFYKSSEQLKISKEIVEFSKKPAEEIAGIVQKSMDKKFSKTAEEKINDLGKKYTKEEWGKHEEVIDPETGKKKKVWKGGKADEVIGEIYPELEALVGSKAKALRNANIPGFSEPDFISGTIAELMTHMRNFDIRKSTVYKGPGGLSGWINGQLRNKIAETLKSGEATKEKFEIEYTDLKEAEQIISEELDPSEILEAKEAAESRAVKVSSFRKSIVTGDGKKGISENLTTTIKDAIITTLGTKLPPVSSKEFKTSLQKTYRSKLKKPVADLLGTRDVFDNVLRKNHPVFKKHLPTSFWLKLERLLKPEDRIFTKEGERLTKQEDVRKAIDEGLIDPNISETAGNTVYSKKDFSVDQLFDFFRGKDVGASTKGTRKDALAEAIAEEFAFDATMEVMRDPAVVKKRKGIAELTGQELAKNEIAEMAKRIDRDPNLKFSTSGPIKFANDALTLIEAISQKGIDKVFDLKSKDLKLLPRYKNIDGTTGEFVFKELFTKELVSDVDLGPAIAKMLQKGVTGVKGGRGPVYEQIMIDVAGRNKGVEVLTKTVEEGGKPDLHALLHGKDFNVEIKMANAQHGSVTVNFLDVNTGKSIIKKKFTFNDAVEKLISETQDGRQIMKERLAEEGIEWNKFNDPIPLELYNQLKTEGIIDGISKTDMNFNINNISEIYNNKPGYPNHYMNIQGKGLYWMGKNPLGLNVPKLEGDAMLTLRPFRGKPNKAGNVRLTYRAIPQIIKNSVKKSNYSLGNVLEWGEFMKSPEVQLLEKLNSKELLSVNNKIAKQAGVMHSKTSNKETLKNLEINDKAIELGRKMKKESKGMSTFDFDETVGVSENYIFATKGKQKKKIASNEWPFVGEQLKSEGWKFDFTDFNKVTKGKPGPLMQKLKNQINKFGNENVFILTARAKESAPAIHEWLKSEGVDVPLKNITGLGNSTGEAKASWMLKKFEEGYNDMYFVDDAMPNVKAVKDVLNQLDIKSNVQAVNMAKVGRYLLDTSTKEGREILDQIRNIKTVSSSEFRKAGRWTLDTSTKEGKEIAKQIDNIKTVSSSEFKKIGNWILDTKTPEGWKIWNELKNIKTVSSSDPHLKKFSRTSLDTDFNKILEESAGVGAKKEFKEVTARMMGAKKGRWKWIIPPSAADFELLTSYTFAGKGKKGEAHQEFFNENLAKPFAKGINEINRAKQKTTEDYLALRKIMPEARKMLNKKIPGTNFTNDAAIRVDRWTKAGYEVPGLSKKDFKTLQDVVKNSPELTAYSEALGKISKQEKGWTKPTENWLVENITADLNNINNKVNRSKYLEQWIENKNIIFSEKNLNKIEAVYGPKHRDALEDMLYRMETGSNRTKGTNKLTNRFMNWTNNSVGAIMFFNMRSAGLQLLSSVNYVNWKENNPLQAAKAFANQPRYWKDFSKLFNSDMLKQRRAGLKMNVNEAEIAAAVENSTNKAASALNYILKKGFLPTQIADSFAIASGGATFYRNRVKMYEKQGLSPKAAEKKAFVDFQEIAEKTQQSARPDLISQQQASPLGRLILAFANTPMQYARIMKKSTMDLASGRGDAKSHVSKIAFYGAIQSMIFAGLQSGMFSMLFDDDLPEDYMDKKTERMANSMTDGLLRGIGVGGASVAAIKNSVMTFMKENDKEWNADYDKVWIDLLNVSPPIGSKVRKLKNAGNSYQFNKDVIPRMGFDIENPGIYAGANVVAATTNVPLDRLITKVNNIKGAVDVENEAWQRIAMMMGYNRWDLGMDKPEAVVKVKEEITEEKKVIAKEKAKVKKEEKKKADLKEKETEGVEKQKKEKEEGKQVTCLVCKLPIEKGKKYCTVHEKTEQRTDGKETQCKKLKKDGKRCGMQTSNKSGYCYYHD